MAWVTGALLLWNLSQSLYLHTLNVRLERLEDGKPPLWMGE